MDLFFSIFSSLARFNNSQPKITSLATNQPVGLKGYFISYKGNQYQQKCATVPTSARSAYYMWRQTEEGSPECAWWQNTPAKFCFDTHKHPSWHYDRLHKSHINSVWKDSPLSPLHHTASFLWSLYSGGLSEKRKWQTDRRWGGCRRRKKTSRWETVTHFVCLIPEVPE